VAFIADTSSQIEATDPPSRAQTHCVGLVGRSTVDASDATGQEVNRQYS
jgi:hypothetical protein